MRGSSSLFTGMVRRRTKGKASAAAVDMTTHSRDRHSSCTQVNRCIRTVRTCTHTRTHTHTHTHTHTIHTDKHIHIHREGRLTHT